MNMFDKIKPPKTEEEWQIFLKEDAFDPAELLGRQNLIRSSFEHAMGASGSKSHITPENIDGVVALAEELVNTVLSSGIKEFGQFKSVLTAFCAVMGSSTKNPVQTILLGQAFEQVAQETLQFAVLQTMLDGIATAGQVVKERHEDSSVN